MTYCNTMKEAVDYCKAHAREYLDTRKAADGRTWICPECGNGTGAHGGGLDFIPGNKPGHLKCHACGWHGDIIDYIGAVKGAPKGSLDAFNAAFAAFGVGFAVDGVTRSTAEQEEGDR